MPHSLTYRLTRAMVAAHAGGPAVCLAPQAEGQVYRLHAGAPDKIPATLRYLPSRDLVRAARADLIGGMSFVREEEEAPLLARVSIVGPLESVAGYHGECGGWCDGYGGEAGVITRMRRALADADVLLTCDSPGGAVIGLPECVDAILEAKEEYSRCVYVVVSGWAASAMYWIAACVADPGEFYITRSSMAGNIGCRASHCNEAGALAQAGLEITDFAWPPGKIALSPNRAPTEAGIRRGERDVMIGGEAFAAAVEAARPALTREAIVALDGDLLTGKAAVKADLVDAVAGVDDVEAWALARAAAPGETDMHVRGEGDDKPDKNDNKAEGPPSKPGERAEGDDKPEMSCTKCGEEKRGDARYCAKCGTKFQEPEAKDDEPTSSKDPEALAALARGGQAAKVAAMSLPALRAHAVDLGAQLADVNAALNGGRTRTAIGGKVEVLTRDAAKAARYRRERNDARAAAEYRERLDLLASLYTHDPANHSRGKLVIDVIDPNTGKPTGQVKPAPQWGTGPEGRTIDNLRAYTKSALGASDPASRERSPYTGPPLEADEKGATDRVVAAKVEGAKGLPAVRQAVKAGVNEDEAAAIHAREFGGG